MVYTIWYIHNIWYMVYTWALKGFLYPCFGVYVCTVRILGPFGSREPDEDTRDFLMVPPNDDKRDSLWAPTVDGMNPA